MILHGNPRCNFLRLTTLFTTRHRIANERKAQHLVPAPLQFFSCQLQMAGKRLWT